MSWPPVASFSTSSIHSYCCFVPGFSWKFGTAATHFRYKDEPGPAHRVSLYSKTFVKGLHWGPGDLLSVMAFEICSRLGHAPPTFYIFRNGSIPESWTHFGRPFFLESNVSRHRWLKINYGESVAASRLFLSPVIRFSGIQSVPHWLLSAPRSWSPIISFSLLFLFSVLSNNISFLKFRMNGEKTGLSSQLLNFDLCRAECAISQFLFF